MKKKRSVTLKDKTDWFTFIEQMDEIPDKDAYLHEKNENEKKIRKLDLHGLSLDEANKTVEKFIIKSFINGYRKILIVTGKGIRSKIYNDPYRSEKMGKLKYSVPQYINNNTDLLSKISSISKAELKDGGEGAFYIFLKNKKNL